MKCEDFGKNPTNAAPLAAIGAEFRADRYHARAILPSSRFSQVL
jgi:hypothetical protein